MSEFKSSNFTNEDNSGGPDLVGVTTFTSPYYFVPPSGTTAERPSGDGLAPGMLRFNTDIGRLEVWRGDHWATILGESPSLNGGARGLIGGSGQVAVDFITISTLGDAQDFGDLTTNKSHPSACASRTRGIFGGGYTGTPTATFLNVIEFVTIASTGNGTDFGDFTQSKYGGAACSNSTRGVFGGAHVSDDNIEYITIASAGNAQDFGNLSEGRYLPGSCSSSVRGVFGGGITPTVIDVIDYITISSTGDSQDFGNLTSATHSTAASSSSTRGLFGGGNNPSTVNTIDFITIASLGNAQDFGDLTSARGALSSCSQPTRAVFAGGNSGGNKNTIDYITIASTGDAVDFGDLIAARSQISALSNGHGGL